MTDNDYLIPINGLKLETLEEGELDTFTRTSDYLPQIRVYSASNDVVKEGKFPLGHFGLYFTKDNIVDLTEQFDCLVIGGRPRATIILGDSPVSFYGKKTEKSWEFSDEFKEIQAKSMAKEQGYLCGLEYLLWLPNLSKYALFLMGNPTLRRESDKVKALIGKAATLKIRFIKAKSGYSWHGATVLPCTTPFNMPDMDELKKQVISFNNPVDSELELAKQEERER